MQTGRVTSTPCPAGRRLSPAEPEDGPPLELVDGADGPVWVVRSFALTRQLLRRPDATRQAGFGAEQVERMGDLRRPILYLEGDQHRERRRAAARFFAPVVIEGYRPMMERLADELVAGLRTDRTTDLSRLSLRMAVQVSGAVIGLTNSSVTGMSRRLGAFFAGDPMSRGRGPAGRVRQLLAGGRTGRFYWLDVKPAIRSRRRRPGADIISQLIDKGFSDLEILTECLTYASAGMATTRELITAAAWHLLEDPGLLATYRSGDVAARRALLEELLRIEPVVGYLRRRTIGEVSLDGPDGPLTIPAGALVDLRLRMVNDDPAVLGDAGAAVCPGRTLPSAVPTAVMSFGDGHHRCPGGPLAVMESEVFLSRLFERDLVADAPPRVRWNPVSQGYDLDRFPVRLAG
ncbi:cytochrome P450 [Microlunatus aurantiacus]|uniref:Cytochrome P450 n=1 Tax=Microlunatus aurantiacus TaxID=446786 RepID=A0ABP7CWM2_9ACTN